MTWSTGGTAWQRHPGLRTPRAVSLQGTAGPEQEFACTTGDEDGPRLRAPSPWQSSGAARAEEDGEKLLPSVPPFGAFQKDPAEFRTAVIRQKQIAKARREILHALRRREVNRNL